MPLYAGIEKLEKEGDSVQWGGPRLGAGAFPTADGRAHFSVVKIPRVDVPLGRFVLTTAPRQAVQLDELGPSDPLTGGSERNAILLDRRDLDELGLSEGDPVIVRSDHAELRATARAGPCRQKHAQGYWPECNVLLERRYDPASGEPDYNTTVTIERA